MDLGDLPPLWWGTVIESQASIEARAGRFRHVANDWPQEARTVVVSHWGFIRALTGLEVGNGAFVRYHPADGHARLEDGGALPVA